MPFVCVKLSISAAAVWPMVRPGDGRVSSAQLPKHQKIDDVRVGDPETGFGYCLEGPWGYDEGYCTWTRKSPDTRVPDSKYPVENRSHPYPNGW